MKRIFFLAALLLGVLTMPVFAQAANPESKILVKVAPKEGKILKINLANLQKEKTVVQLKNLEGSTYFTKVVRNHNGFLRQLNLSQLPKGRYVLSVSQNDEVISQVVVIDEAGLKLSAISR
jgi:hypothetical protein